MEEDHCKYKIPLFDGSNWNNWKYRMEILLEEYDLLEHLEENLVTKIVIEDTDSAKVKTEKEKNIQELLKNQRKCKSLIVQKIADTHLEYIKDAKTPNEIWKILVTNFQRKGISTQIYLRKKLLLMKLSEGELLTNHFLEF